MRPSPTLAALLATVTLVTAACGEEVDDAPTVTTSTTAAEPAEPAAPGGPVTTAPPLEEGETEEETEEVDEVEGQGSGEGEAAGAAGSSSPEGRVVSLVVDGGQVTSSGDDRIEVAAGETLVLEVTSDVVEEVHVHGYDIEVALAPGEPTTIEILGDLPGVWEVELHGSGTKLTELAVGG